MMKDQLIQEFQIRFQKEPAHIFFCPGRVNLIGEHIDYNGGNVMPFAISLGTYLAVAKNTDKELRFHSLNFPETATLQLQSSYSKTGKDWYNYPLGVVDQLLQNDNDLSGLDMLFSGNLPVGAGLSSSASIEVLTGFALSKIYGIKIPNKDIAVLAQKVENEFIGMNCGIMDQFAVAMGQKDKVILLNCDTLDFEYLPFTTGNYSLVIINSNKQRSLTESKYNERFAECGAALKLLKQKLPIEHLCNVDIATFEQYKELIKDTVLEKRALHVVTENARVKDAVIALQTGDLEVLGKLLYASHRSLKELYEVSGNELDAIVDFCKTFQGCIGARMTGAGFGGCAIALIKKDRIRDFESELILSYTSKIGYAPQVFISEIAGGVGEITYKNHNG